MNIFVIINQVIILFLMMCVGFFARRKGMITDDGRKTLSTLLINITCPFIIIASFKFNFSMKLLQNITIVLIFSFVSQLVLILFGKVLFNKFKGDKGAILRFAIIFSNSTYMGFPVLQAVYGKIGILYGSIFQLAFNIFLWTYGVALLKGKTELKDIKSAFMNPAIISIFIGLFIFLFSIKLPAPIYNTLDMVGAMTIPISMMIIGSNLADMKLKAIFLNFELYYVSFIRLLLIPIVSLMLLKVSGVHGVVLGTCVIIEAMPAASMLAVLSEQYGSDRNFASQCVFITTLLSLITIPVIITIL